MKNTLLILLVLAACKSSDPAPTYPSSEGLWKFQTSSVKTSGSFSIATFGGNLVVDNDYGQFAINGTTFKVATRQAITPGAVPGTFSQIWILDATSANGISFDNAEVNKEFNKITCKGFHYVIGSKTYGPFTETVTITR